MSAQTLHPMSESDYLTFERASTLKHEYYRGQIYAMTGAKEAHNVIAGNTIATLHGQVRYKPCRIYPSDMRVKVLETGLNTYPDITIICGQPHFTDQTRDTVTNPIVIIEILSPSTERYDRGLKFQNYRTVSTLMDYILIAQNQAHVEHYARQETGRWELQEARSKDTSLTITSVEFILRLEDIYDKVDFIVDEADSLRDTMGS